MISSQRSESLRQRASTFDPDAALSALGPSSWNGEYYRLDEHLASATIEARSPRVDRASPSIAGAFDFDGGRDERCRAEGKATFENGILKMSFADGRSRRLPEPGWDSERLRRLHPIPPEGSCGQQQLDVGWSRSDLTAWSLRPEINIDDAADHPRRRVPRLRARRRNVHQQPAFPRLPPSHILPSFPGGRRGRHRARLHPTPFPACRLSGTGGRDLLSLRRERPAPSSGRAGSRQASSPRASPS